MGKLAVIIEFFGVALTVFIMALYYVHLIELSEFPIERMRYTAIIYSAATAFFTLSLSMGLTALAVRREKKAFWFILVSAVAAALGYIFPCHRLWIFGYAAALNETILIAIIHVGLLAFAAFLLKRQNTYV